MKILTTVFIGQNSRLVLIAFFLSATIQAYGQFGGHGIFGSTSVAMGDEATYTSMGNCSDYIWTVSKGNIIGNSSGGSITVLWTQSGTGNIHLSCSGTSYTLDVTVESSMGFTVEDNCGSSFLERSNPPYGSTYYWQTSSSGTSTANSAKYRTVTSAGDYFLRSRSDANGNWGTAVSRYASPKSVPAQPTIPSYSIINNCGSTSINRPNNTASISYYWQTSSGGTSTTNDSDPYVVTQSGTYYLRALGNNGCWSTALSVPVTVKGVPNQPPAPTVANYCGYSNLTRATPPTNETYYWQTSSNGTSTANSAAVFKATTSGTYYLRSRHSNGCWSTARSIAVTVKGAANQPPVPTVANNCGYSNLTRATPPTNETYYWQTSSGGTSTANSATILKATTSGTYYLRPLSNSGCWGASRSISVQVKVPAAAPSLAIDDHRFGEGNISPAVEGTETSYRWYTQASGGSPIAGVSGKVYAHSPATTTTYYVAGANSDGCESSRIAVTAYRYPAAVIKSDGDMLLSPGEVIKLSTGGFDTYQWMRDGLPAGTSPSLQVSWPGEYWVEVSKNGHSIVSGRIMIDKAYDFVSSLSHQHVIVTTLKKEGVKTDDFTSLTEHDLHRFVRYMDGLGRPVQSVSHKGSPMGRDIVQAYAYNEFGQSPKSFLPYTSQSSDGQFKTDALLKGTYEQSAQYQFYQTASAVAHDKQPYSQSVFESSPLHRLEEQAAVGEAWQPGDKSNTTDWQLNTTADAVRKWSLSGSGLPVSSSRYAAGSLGVSSLKNEDGQLVKTYTDMRGRSILTRQLSADGTKQLETYTVFDAFDRPVFVLPPQALSLMHASGSYTPTAAFLDSWAQQLSYDRHHRVIAQKAAGSDWQEIVYDRWHRPVLMQDGNRRQQGQWYFIKYDMQGRSIISGIHNSSLGRAALQSQVDGFYANAPELRGEQAGGAFHGYTNRSFPDNVASEDVLSVNYYDDYSHLPAASQLAYSSRLGNPLVPSADLVGLPTAAKVKIIGREGWLWQVLYYDKDYRLVQAVAENHLGGSDRTSNAYSPMMKWERMLSPRNPAAAAEAVPPGASLAPKTSLVV